MLTELEVKRAKPRDKDYKLADAGGLHLFVSTAGRRTWRWKYRFEGKEKRIVFGAWPEISIRQARESRDEAKKTLRLGRDPQAEAKRTALVGQSRRGETFEKFARAWHHAQTPRWKAVHAADVIQSLERDLFPMLGDYPIADIDEPLMLAALQAVEARGAIETARRLRQRADRIFRYAKGAGAGNGNPAIDVAATLKPVPAKKRWPAITDLDKLRVMVRDVEAAGAMPVTRLASRFLGLTAQRPGMVRKLPWAEIENIDWESEDAPAPEALWRVPADRMKQEHDQREDLAYEHLVPLAPQSVETLRAVRRLTGRGTMAFCSSLDGDGAMSENAVGYLYNRIGYKGVHVPHGWRSAFSTIMNQRAERAHVGDNKLLIDRLIIDLMLAHVPSGMSATEFRYNRAQYLERRRELASEWADLLLEGSASAFDAVGGRRRAMAR